VVGPLGGVQAAHVPLPLPDGHQVKLQHPPHLPASHLVQVAVGPPQLLATLQGSFHTV
jgi:hypothetical protein